MATTTKAPLKAAINGCGRIGRTVASVLLQRDDVELVAFNEPFCSLDYMAYMLKNCFAASGRKVEVVVKDDKTLILGDKTVTVFAHKKPEEIPWGETSAEYIVEATGVFTGKDEAAAHLKSGVKKVIICAPSKDAPVFITGVNEETYTSNLDVVSAASSTTNSVAPLAKFINDKFGIAEGFVTSFYSTPVTQKTVWMPTRGPVPVLKSMDDKDIMALGRVVPPLGIRLTWNAVHLPTTDASMVDLTVRLKSWATYDHIKRVVKEESEGKLKGILGYADAAVAATDVVGDSRSCVLVAKAGTALSGGNMVKLVWLQDEHWAYCNRVVDLMKHMSETC